MTGKTILLAISVGCAMWLMSASATMAGGAGGCGCGGGGGKPPPPQHHNHNINIHNNNNNYNQNNNYNRNDNYNVNTNNNSNRNNNYNQNNNENQNNNAINNKVNVTVISNSTATADSSASAFASAFGSGGGFGGGGSSVYSAPNETGIIQGVNVESGGEGASYEAERTKLVKVVVQAFCFDDKEVPHPASQVTPDREIEDAYDGEVYRCIAGSHMQVTIAKWTDALSFAGGDTLSCQKGEALYHTPGQGGGRLECRAQKPARDCNERSLLRRFGAGIKVMMVAITEKSTAYREESHESVSGNLTLDGGVGGVAF